MEKDWPTNIAKYIHLPVTHFDDTSTLPKLELKRKSYGLNYKIQMLINDKTYFLVTGNE